MVTTLYLVRHGAVEGADAKRYYGTIDVPLSAEGKEQMREAAVFIKEHLVKAAASRQMSFLADLPTTRNITAETTGGSLDTVPRLSAVYSSNLQRAVTGAEIIAEPHGGLIPLPLPSLRERSFGIWEGMSFTEIREKFPSELQKWSGNPLTYSPPGGENTLAVNRRVVKALDQIIARHSDTAVAIVAHGGVNRVFLCHIMGIPLENIFMIEQDYGAVNIIEFWDTYPVVKLLNGGIRG